MEEKLLDTPLENEGDPQKDPQEKTFTQADVDRIVKSRLERDRASRSDTWSKELADKEKSITEREKAFGARESRLNCIEYCYQNGYDLSLVDILDTGDINTFMDKVDKISKLSNARQYVAPPASNEPVGSGSYGGPLAAAFSPDYKHTPKQWPPRFNE